MFWFIFCQDDLLLQKTGEGMFTVPMGEEPPVVLKAWNTVHNITPMDDGTLVKTVRVDNSVKLTNGERATIGAARGCKPGYTRHTYVLPEQMINQVKAVAQFFCCSEVSAAEQLIQKGLDDIKKKHGKKALTLQKTQTLFD